MEQKISKTLQELGIPAHIKGYEYLRYALSILTQKNCLPSVTTDLYPIIAKKYNCTVTSIERAIHHAIAISWARNKPETCSYPMLCLHRKPTNSEFFTAIIDRLQLL